MDQFFQVMAENPFTTIGWAMIIGCAIMVVGVIMALYPLPKIKGEIREELVGSRWRIFRLHKYGSQVGLAGVTIVLVALLVLIIIVTLPVPPANY